MDTTTITTTTSSSVPLDDVVDEPSSAARRRNDKRQRMVDVYEQNKDTTYSSIANIAKVSYRLVARWLPVYKRTGKVVDDDVKPGPRKGTHHQHTTTSYCSNRNRNWHTTYTRRYGQNQRAQKRWRMIEVYLKDTHASFHQIAKEANVSVSFAAKWIPIFKNTGGLCDTDAIATQSKHSEQHKRIVVMSMIGKKSCSKRGKGSLAEAIAHSLGLSTNAIIQRAKTLRLKFHWYGIMAGGAWHHR